jgi:hypothetical protein
MMAPLSWATLLKASRRMRFSGDLGEEAFDHVEPGRRGQREVQVKARMRCEPAFDGRVLSMA